MNALPLGHCDPSLARPSVEALDEGDLIAGDPIVRYTSLHKTSDGSTVGLRDFSAGRFRRRYAVDEVLHVVEGGATVIDESHRVWALREGDVVTFRQGTTAKWQVPEYMRALAFTCQAATQTDLNRNRTLQAAKMVSAAIFGLALAGAATTATIAASIFAS